MGSLISSGGYPHISRPMARLVEGICDTVVRKRESMGIAQSRNDLVLKLESNRAGSYAYQHCEIKVQDAVDLNCTLTDLTQVCKGCIERGVGRLLC